MKTGEQYANEWRNAPASTSLNDVIDRAIAEVVEECARACQEKAKEHRDLSMTFTNQGLYAVATVHDRYAQALDGSDGATALVRALLRSKT